MHGDSFLKLLEADKSRVQRPARHIIGHFGDKYTCNMHKYTA